MTHWTLSLTEQTDPRSGDVGILRTLADVDTTEPAVIGATLRALADRLDPPKPAGPAWRGGEVLPPVRSRELHVEYLDDDGPSYAHDAHCNTIHEAGPEPCPPPRCGQPGHGTIGCDCHPDDEKAPPAR